MGRWLWLNDSYRNDEQMGVALGPLHVGDGRQYVYWQAWDKEAGAWWPSPRFALALRDAAGVPVTERCFPTVTVAVQKLLLNGEITEPHRLLRFDRTPLLTVWQERGRLKIKGWK